MLTAVISESRCCFQLPVNTDKLCAIDQKWATAFQSDFYLQRPLACHKPLIIGFCKPKRLLCFATLKKRKGIYTVKLVVWTNHPKQHLFKKTKTKHFYLTNVAVNTLPLHHVTKVSPVLVHRIQYVQIINSNALHYILVQLMEKV